MHIYNAKYAVFNAKYAAQLALCAYLALDGQ